MEARIFTPTYELFLVLQPLRNSFFDFLDAIEALDEEPAPPLIGVDLYYREITDVGLLALRFDERRMSHSALQWINDLAAGAAIPILDPSRLDDTDRKRFYHSYLPRYEIRVEDLAGARAVLSEIGRRMGLVKARAATHTEEPKRLPTTRLLPEIRRPPPLPRAASGDERPASEPPALPAHLHKRRLGSTPPTGPVLPEEPMDQLSAPERAATARDHAPRRAATIREPVRGIDSSSAVTSAEPPSAKGKGKERQRRETRPERPLAKGATPAGPNRVVADSTGPEDALDSNDVSLHVPPDIDVRFLRGGEWIAARLRTLSLKGAYLVTGALPRKGDMVHVSLGFRGDGAMINGLVHHVTTVEDATETGSSGFAVRFSQDDSQARRQLISVLRRARAEGVTIKPPPSRVAVRFLVNWPVRMGSRIGGFHANALDVSAGGMFVQTFKQLPKGDLVFRISLDNCESVIHGRARIARQVTDQMAMARGLQPGYGVIIAELSASDRQRWSEFLHRVRERSDRRVLLGASPERLKELGDGLTGAGYAVVSASAPALLLRLAQADQRPPDMAIIDSSLVQAMSDRDSMRRTFEAMNVPVVLSGAQEPVVQTRLGVDRILRVAA